MNDKCHRCGELLAAHSPTCTNCGIQADYPNVRAATQVLEIAQLNVRLAGARASAEARNCDQQLEEFGLAVLNSKAVMARNVSVLGAMVYSDRALYTTFHEQVRAVARLPEDNEEDQIRQQIESAFFPHYFQHINYAALSLDGRGIDWFGGYFITFKEKMIDIRTSVFEENLFDFVEKHALPLNKRPPPGYRSTWSSRNELAMAKLGSKIRDASIASDFPGILLNQPAPGAARCDYVECHIYGSLSGAAIESVKAPKPTNSSDEMVWLGIRERLETLGADVEEF